MMRFVFSTAEFLILIPGLLVAYLPAMQYLRMPPRRLALLTISLTLSVCLTGGGLCYFFFIRARWLLFPAAAVVGLWYIHTVDLARWKSVSIFLALCASYSYIGNIAAAVDAILCPGNTAPFLSPKASLFYNLMCWTTAGIVWRPTTHEVKNLLEEEFFAQTWYVFWILPTLFIGLNLILHTFPELLSQRRLIRIYIIINLALRFLLFLFYAMFYLMAITLNRNNRLHRENQFLSMQQAQYENLRTSIAETRKARHDMRHHFNAMKGLAAHEKWEKLSDYLVQAAGLIPDAELNLCENTAADAVAAHYGMLFQKHSIPFSFALDLPCQLPVPEIDICLTLSNLLENALEASLKTPLPKRQISVQAHLHFDRMILITVENAFDDTVKETNGIFQSSKHQGEGIGIQSVRHIAQKNGGYSRFFYEDGTFHANVILRGETT